MRNISLKRVLSILFAGSVLLMSSISVYTQDRKVDSLRQLLIHAKDDTTASRYLWRLAQYYLDIKKNEDSTLFYASKGYALAEKHTFLYGMWGNLAEQCFVYQMQGNYQKALRLYLDFLKLCEERRSKPEEARVIHYISDLYIKMEDYQQAISYAKRNSQNIIESGIGFAWRLSNLYTIGIGYVNLNQPDSALAYFQQGFALASTQKDYYRAGGWLDQMLVGLGMANQQMGNIKIAAAYFDEAIRYEKEFKSEELGFAYIQKAKLFVQQNQSDSAISYYEKALQHGRGIKMSLSIYKALAGIYLKKDQQKSLQYFALTQKLSDSLFAADKLKAIEAITFNEEERQRELVAQQKEAAEIHNTNIENTFIAIGIISFLILFLLLSQSIIVNEKWIRLLGIIGLLMLFEFINLLLHPLLETFTHHSSLYMLLIMVCIAALLVPLHHKIEKWVTGRMVEKNKQIRVAAAKRTIDRLGSN